jgi:hypothetical protein
MGIIPQIGAMRGTASTASAGAVLALFRAESPLKLIALKLLAPELRTTLYFRGGSYASQDSALINHRTSFPSDFGARRASVSHALRQGRPETPDHRRGRLTRSIPSQS